MASEIVMPRMGLTMETGKIVQWLKQEGQFVKAGEPLLEIETDKATAEIEALESGMLGKIIGTPGMELAVGAVIGYLLKDGESAPQIMESSLSATPEARSTPTLDTSNEILVPSNQKVKASPAARRLAKTLGVDLEQIRGSGPHGRVVAWNVVEAGSSTRQAPSAGRISPVAQRVAADLGVNLAQVQGSGPAGTITRRDVEIAAQIPKQGSAVETGAAKIPEIEPFTRIQRVMSERMTHSFGTAPHFYLHAEVDARQMTVLREQLLDRLEQRDHVHVTFTDLLICFCARILPRHPLVMAQWTPQGLQKFHDVHIGIAVDTENGLVVPVIRDADTLGLTEIARKRADFAERARKGKLLPSEFEEGVFTITNLGMYRIDSFDAILNPSQAAILAVGQIKQRALVESGQLIPAATINLSLSVDHRVLDGARAAHFLSELVEMIEIPGLSMA